MQARLADLPGAFDAHGLSDALRGYRGDLERGTRAVPQLLRRHLREDGRHRSCPVARAHAGVPRYPDAVQERPVQHGRQEGHSHGARLRGAH